MLLTKSIQKTLQVQTLNSHKTETVEQWAVKILAEH